MGARTAFAGKLSGLSMLVATGARCASCSPCGLRSGTPASTMLLVCQLFDGKQQESAAQTCAGVRIRDLRPGEQCPGCGTSSLPGAPCMLLGGRKCLHQLGAYCHMRIASVLPGGSCMRLHCLQALRNAMKSMLLQRKLTACASTTVRTVVSPCYSAPPSTAAASSSVTVPGCPTTGKMRSPPCPPPGETRHAITDISQ